MKQLSALSYSLFICVGIATAQPSLSSGSVTPIPGDHFSYLNGAWLAPGPAGTSQTWDYSASALTAQNTNSFVAMSGTGLASSFPNATVASDLTGGNYTFSRGTATSYEDDGSSISGTVVTCTDRQMLMQYPMNYNSTFTDGMACDVAWSGQNWTQTGSITATADGWGTVITASGTIANVLRVHTLRHITDYHYTPATTYDNDSYYFYKPGVRSPVVVIDHSLTDFFGIIVADSSLTALDAGTIGIDEAMLHDIGVDVMPNPVTDRLEVVFGTDAGHILSIDLLDVTGRSVRTLSHRTQVAGVQREFIDMNTLPAGAYLVRVTDEHGATGMKRVIRN